MKSANQEILEMARSSGLISQRKGAKVDYPPLRIVRFSGKALTEGVEVRSIDDVNVRVSSIARTVVDCFKFRNKIGLDVALEALREAWGSQQVTMDELWDYAILFRVGNVMRPYLESLT